MLIDSVSVAQTAWSDMEFALITCHHSDLGLHGSLGNAGASQGRGPHETGLLGWLWGEPFSLFQLRSLIYSSSGSDLAHVWLSYLYFLSLKWS